MNEWPWLRLLKRACNRNGGVNDQGRRVILTSSVCWLVSRSVPNAKSTLVAILGPRLRHLTDPPQELLRLVQLMDRSNHARLDPLTRSPKPPVDGPSINPHTSGRWQPSKIIGHHVTIAQPHVTRATSLVDPLAVDLGPEGPNPRSFHSISILSNANTSLIAPQSSPAPLCSFPIRPHLYAPLCPVRIPIFPLLHADSRPSHRGAPDLIPDSLLVLATLWFYFHISSSLPSLYFLSSIIISLIPIEHCFEES